MPPKDEPAGGVIAADVHEPRGDASARHKDGEGRQAGACVDQGAVPRLKLFGSQTSRGLGEVDGVVRTGLVNLLLIVRVSIIAGVMRP
jgi:hypothetical protein